MTDTSGCTPPQPPPGTGPEDEGTDRAGHRGQQRTATAASPRTLVAPSAPAPPDRAPGRGHCGMPPPPDDEQLRTSPSEPSAPTTTRDCAVWLSIGPSDRRPTGTVAAGSRNDPPAVDRRQGRRARSPPAAETIPLRSTAGRADGPHPLRLRPR